ncbi:orotate phosphoribosyltransferase [Hirschia maritima]|uniref:orotate phosphoribosyltransferase n=1 Tax=Hirschia maritima TaxID=1121961 RepID=UPI00036F75B7|nr:orotate phosphoribosyltransferase [Hirschia maritima]
MNTEEVLSEFRKVDALLEGHFILSSGRRSPVFLQKALVFSHPATSEKLCAALAEKLKAQFGQIDVVCGPAVGGLIPGYETARALGCRAIFTERQDGEMTLRRGFDIKEGERVVVVEDIVTTGLSMRETFTALNKFDGDVIGGACVVDRSNGEAEVGLPLVSLAAVDFPDFDPDDLPAELKDIPAIKPGSRGLK